MHPAGSLGAQLKTVEDIMITGNKIPFVKRRFGNESSLDILSEKIRYLIVRGKIKKLRGIITDGQIRRITRKI